MWRRIVVVTATSPKVCQGDETAAGRKVRTASRGVTAGAMPFRDCFTEAIRLKPDYADAYYLRAFYRDTLEKDVRGALEDVNEAIPAEAR